MNKYGILLFIGLLGLGLSLSSMTANEGAVAITGTVTDGHDGSPLVGVNVSVKGTTRAVITGLDGSYTLMAEPSDRLVFAMVGYATEEVRVGRRTVIDVVLEAEVVEMLEEHITLATPEPMAEYEDVAFGRATGAPARSAGGAINRSMHTSGFSETAYAPPPLSREEYAAINERGFVKPQDEPLSTFSIDVDAASYANMRRFITQGQRPPQDAIRIEEMVNYFNYDYPQPVDEHPFSITTEVGAAPWAPDHYLVHVGLQGREIATEDLPPSNLVFLLDVSGSMYGPTKLDLVKRSMIMLSQQLRKQDRVAIVVYAGAAGVVLPSTEGNDTRAIEQALNQLQAGGSTAGGAGIELAYSIAQDNYMEGGNNRVIMCSDGDFNVGVSSTGGLERLIEEKREAGIFLTVLGYGMGNYQDSRMETLADKGNGNYAYIDNALEAQKVLVSEFGGTLHTIAKDVKLQVEFNPRYVQAYRLIGYENRMLNAEDFNDDQKDAGELGSGHTVTALYEIIPVGVDSEFVPSVDDLRYQANANEQAPPTGTADEWATVKFRYKAPQGLRSQLIVHPIVKDETAAPSDNFLWSAAVASFGMLLRDSEYQGTASHEGVLALARQSRGQDEQGYRAEFIRLVEASSSLPR